MSSNSYNNYYEYVHKQPTNGEVHLGLLQNNKQTNKQTNKQRHTDGEVGSLQVSRHLLLDGVFNGVLGDLGVLIKGAAKLGVATHWKDGVEPDKGGGEGVRV